MPIPNYSDIIRELAVSYPDEFKLAHKKGPDGNWVEGSDLFVKRVTLNLHRIDPAVGLNGKRGNVSDLSLDALAIIHPEGGTTDTISGRRMAIIDFIAGAGGSNPSVVWQDVSVFSPGAWIDPENFGNSPPPPKPPTPQKPSYQGDQFWVDNFGKVLEADYKEAGQSLNAGSAVWFARTIWDTVNEGLTLTESIKKHRAEWREVLGLAPFNESM